jgi:hypothetical protein
MHESRDDSTPANDAGPGRDSRKGATEPGGGVENLLDLMIAPYASIMRASAGIGDERKERSPATPIGAGSPDPHAAGEIGTYLAQAYLSMATRGVHYWWRMVQIHTRHQSDIVGSLAADASREGLGRSEQERRVLTDMFRAYLREIGDVSVQEARVLQAQLDRLAASLAESTLDPAATMEKWRRWKVIP